MPLLFHLPAELAHLHGARQRGHEIVAVNRLLDEIVGAAAQRLNRQLVLVIAWLWVGKDGRIIGKYRKIHLPGHADHRPQHPYQNLEKRYFEVGNLGFPVWKAFDGRVGMMICNDRRWPESYRVMGLQGVELIVLGYNTPVHNPEMPEADDLGGFHNHLVMQSGAYQNSTWVVGVAKVRPGCKPSTVDVARDGSRVYYIDVNNSAICVLERTPAEKTAAAQ